MDSIEPFASHLQATILAQLTEGVIVANRAGQITYVNEAAERLHGIAMLGVEPAGFSETYHLFTDDGRPYPPADLPLSRAIRGETVVDARWRIQRPDGTSILAIGSARPIRDASGLQIAAVLTLRDDTEREAAERQLIENEARLRALTDNLPGGMVYQISTGGDGSERRFTFVSQSHEKLTGVPASDVLRDPSIPYMLIHPDDRQRVAEAEQVAISECRPFDVQVRLRRRDGEERWCRILSAPRPQADGSVIWDGIQIDITDQKKAEAALRESEERFRLMADAVPQIVWITDAAGRVEFFNKQWSDYTGVPYEPTTASEVAANHLHPDDAASTIAAFEAARSTGTTYLVEHRIRSRTGGFRWFLVRGEPYRDAQTGEVIRWFGASVDIHDRKLAEAALAKLNETLEEEVVARTAERDQMWNTSPDLMLVIDFEGYIRRVNPAWTALLGYAPEELVGLHANEIVLPEDHALTADAYTTAAAGQRVEAVNRCRHKDGSLRWISWVAAPAGNMTYATGRDVTAQRERAAELKRYHDIIDATTAPICAFDTDYKLIAFNRAHNHEFRRVNGFETKVGDIFPDLFIPEQAEIMRALMSRALAGESFTVVEEFGRPELDKPCWEISYTPLRDEEGRVVGAFHHALDISERLRAQTELERAQEALRQSQKMEAMGSLTGGVAHDFNNLLTPIVGSLDLLQRKGLGGERDRRLIEGALQSAERAKTLVQRLLAFARRQPLQSCGVDVGRLVEGMADLLASTTGPQVRVVVDVADNLPPANADPNQLEMALLNLGVNARDAMVDGGTLRISVTRESLREARGELGVGDYVRLSVADTGCGMDEPTLARAVEPFFSTKGIGKGTGLGLSMAHGLAAQLGGALTLQSRVGVGTNVELWLPISTAPVRNDELQSHSVHVDGQQGVALLVDDEDNVRASTAAMLSDLGYRVHEADSGEAALRLVRDGLRPDLLVTDHLMPGITGVDLVQAIRAKWPDVPALIVSGYAEAEGIAPNLPRLTKPFRISELADKLGNLHVKARL
jgi:PAS domain S-box-containing protein